MTGNTFNKSQRLCGNSLTDMLFSQGDRSVSCFPVRLVWLLRPAGHGIEEHRETDRQGETAVRILISAPKRHFKHAVDRNRIKRQVREYYRTHCHNLESVVKAGNNELFLAFLFTDSRLWPGNELYPKLDIAFDKLVKRLQNVK